MTEPSIPVSQKTQKVHQRKMSDSEVSAPLITPTNIGPLGDKEFSHLDELTNKEVKGVVTVFCFCFRPGD
jgi:hypothetical protein